MEKVKCQECWTQFEPYEYTSYCTWGCDEGVYLSERDYGDVEVKCSGCNGTGEQTLTEQYLCKDCNGEL